MSDPYWVGAPEDVLEEVLEVDLAARETLADIFFRAAMKLGAEQYSSALLLAACVLTHGKTTWPMTSGKRVEP